MAGLDYREESSPPRGALSKIWRVSESPLRRGIHGQKATSCCGPAIANAIYDACGVRLTELPLNAEAVYRAIRAQQNNPLGDE